MFNQLKLQSDQILKVQFLIQAETDCGGGARSAITDGEEMFISVFCSKLYFRTETGNAKICVVKEALAS